MTTVTDRRAWQKLINARTSLIISNGFFGTLALHLDLVEATSVGSHAIDTMAVDGRRMYYNPEFVHKLNDRELEGVVAHEVMHCFPAGTFVGGDCMNIENYSIGQSVIDQDGELVKIVETGNRQYKGNLFSIKAKGMLPVEATGEHPFLVRQTRWVNVEKPERRQIRQWSEPQWVKAKDVKAGDWIAVPQLKGVDQPKLTFTFGNPWSVSQQVRNGIVMDPELAELVGWYVAKGWTSTPPSGVVRTSMAFALHEQHVAMHLADIIERRIGVATNISIHDQNNGYVLNFASAGFGRWLLENCGKGALDKQIPLCILENRDTDVLLSFLKYYVNGGGHFSNVALHFGTVSRKLAMQLQLAFARFGYLCNLHLRKPYRYTIRGKSGDSNALYHGHLANAELLKLFGRTSSAKRPTQQFECVDGMIFVPVKKVSSREWEGQVFNFETETHTYSAGNLVTHNCCFKHFTRIGERHLIVWNIAGDHVINLDLLESGFTLPEPRLADPQYKGMTTEEVYDRLPVKFINIKGKGKPGEGMDPGMCGGVLEAPGDEDENEAVKQEWETAVRMAVHVASQSDPGKIPGSLRRLIENLKKPKVSWRDYTRRFIDDSMIKDVSWSRLSRRSVSIGTLMPGYIADRLNHLVMFIDVSGSINDELMREFISEVAGALDEGTADRISVVYADTHVRQVDEWVQGDVVTASSVGGGGTSFADSFRWLSENAPNASCVIYLTDLEVSEFGEEPTCPVMWAVYAPTERYGQLSDNVPWGTPIHISTFMG